MRAVLFIIGALLLLTVVASVLFYPKIEEPMVTHWDENDQPNGSMNKFWGVALLPLMMLALCIIFYIIPYMDKSRNIEKFRNYYNGFLVILMLYFMGIQFQLLAWNLGFKINPIYMITLGSAVMFYYIGVMLEHTGPNAFVGIRLPWTMKDQKVWKKTHIYASKAFRIASFFMLLGFIFPDFGIILMIIPLLVAVISSIVYSYRIAH